MDKPLSIKKEEFEQGLVQLINNSGLPAFILDSIFKAYALEIKELSMEQANRDRQAYLASLDEKEEVIANEELERQN